MSILKEAIENKILPKLTEHEIPQSNVRLRFGKAVNGNGNSVRRVVLDVAEAPQIGESPHLEDGFTQYPYEPRVVFDVEDPPPEVSDPDIHVHSTWESETLQPIEHCTELEGDGCNFSSRNWEDAPRGVARQLLGLMEDEVKYYFPNDEIPNGLRLALSIYVFSLIDSLGLTKENTFPAPQTA